MNTSTKQLILTPAAVSAILSQGAACPDCWVPLFEGAKTRPLLVAVADGFHLDCKDGEMIAPDMTAKFFTTYARKVSDVYVMLQNAEYQELQRVIETARRVEGLRGTDAYRRQAFLDSARAYLDVLRPELMEVMSHKQYLAFYEKKIAHGVRSTSVRPEFFDRFPLARRVN